MTQIPQDQFPQVSGMRYLRFFRWLHQHRRPNWYLEVGTHMGRSLDIATCRSIAVDPNFLVNRGVIGTKPELHCLSQTSDDFSPAVLPSVSVLWWIWRFWTGCICLNSRCAIL